MLYLIIAVILFLIIDLIIRFIIKTITEKKQRAARRRALQMDLKLDFSQEARSLKRVQVDKPKAKILAVDDEPVILDSFRKILVLDGYSVDTVESGSEVLTLLKTNHYDFVFTDLKMPGMDGVQVTEAVKNMRPDIDVIIITGYATVETAVETMKYGAMDYVQKPFTEPELLEMINKCYEKRQQRLKNELLPKVEVTHADQPLTLKESDFAIPGGAFIDRGHAWLTIEQEGTVRVGLDDFAKKCIGKIDAIELPVVGTVAEKGQSLIIVRQGTRSVAIQSPVSGVIKRVNSSLLKDLERLDITVYDDNWLCIIDPPRLEEEIVQMKIGKAAVGFYLDELERLRAFFIKERKVETKDRELLEYYKELEGCSMEELADDRFSVFVKKFFERTP